MERAWLAVQEGLRASPVAYKLGQRSGWASLDAWLLEGHLAMAARDLARAPEHVQRALELAESPKSRLLVDAASRGALSAPAGAKLVEVEERLLRQLAIVDQVAITGTDDELVLDAEGGVARRDPP